MFCSIYKWKISQAMDSGKPISSLLQRHLQKCDSCREYAEFCTSLKPKLTQDKQVILQDFDKSLNKKIMTAIQKQNGPGSGAAEKSPAHKFSLRRPALIPSLAAAFTVLVISIGILFFALPRSKQRPALDQISILLSAAFPEDVLSKVESPLETEYSELKRAFESTSKYLISSFDFRLGPQAK
jgi:hypothetical protein